jgi:hypothetical protein
MFAVGYDLGGKILWTELNSQESKVIVVHYAGNLYKTVKRLM